MAKTGDGHLAKDSFWEEMLRYCHARLSFYIKEIAFISRDLPLPTDIREKQICENTLNRLINLCKALASQSREALEIESVSDLACLAYELRPFSMASALHGHPGWEVKAKTIGSKICLLGRYRAAYETFKDAAMHFATFKELRYRK